MGTKQFGIYSFNVAVGIAVMKKDSWPQKNTCFAARHAIDLRYLTVINLIIH